MLKYHSDDPHAAARSRRGILKKFGRYAAAATPAMLMLLDANRQSAAADEYDGYSKPVGGPKPKGPKGPKPKGPKGPKGPK
jgi:hypothetical protein